MVNYLQHQMIADDVGKNQGRLVLGSFAASELI
jgi:hypothetical protein